MTAERLKRLWSALASMRLTLACLAALTALVAACTAAEGKLGVFRAVDAFIRSFFVFAPVAGRGVPVFPGGALIGALLLANLVAAQTKLERSWRKSGLWIAHLGLILLFGGEFVAAFARHEGLMTLQRGQTSNFAEDPRRAELCLVDETDPRFDRVYSISPSVLRRRGVVGPPALPLEIRVHRFESELRDEQLDSARADVEVSAGPLSEAGGRWTLSLQDGVRFRAGGRRYLLSLRRRRLYLPVALRLDEFRAEFYPGSDIPRGFSSRVTVAQPGAEHRPPRPALISMNEPLRAAGIVFYQSGFAQDDQASILQVVDNPARLLPYLSCALVGLGLILHFARRLSLAEVLRS